MRKGAAAGATTGSVGRPCDARTACRVAESICRRGCACRACGRADRQSNAAERVHHVPGRHDAPVVTLPYSDIRWLEGVRITLTRRRIRVRSAPARGGLGIGLVRGCDDHSSTYLATTADERSPSTYTMQSIPRYGARATVGARRSRRFAHEKVYEQIRTRKRG